MAAYTGGQLLDPTANAIKVGTKIIFDNGLLLGSAGYLRTDGNTFTGPDGDNSGGSSGGSSKTTGQLWPRY